MVLLRKTNINASMVFFALKPLEVSFLSQSWKSSHFASFCASDEGSANTLREEITHHGRGRRYRDQRKRETVRNTQTRLERWKERADLVEIQIHWSCEFPNFTRFPRARNRSVGKLRERIRGRERNALICDRERGVEQGEIRFEELFEDED